ncbi:MAG: hypothetical protein V3T70_01300 [Phycisphaerae bacterium]
MSRNPLRRTCKGRNGAPLRRGLSRTVAVLLLALPLVGCDTIRGPYGDDYRDPSFALGYFADEADYDDYGYDDDDFFFDVLFYDDDAYYFYDDFDDDDYFVGGYFDDGYYDDYADDDVEDFLDYIYY